MSKTLTEDQKTNLHLVLVHEYRRCDQAFLDFSDHSANQIGLGWSKKNALATYDSYARFLHHLYEFYVGCFKQNKGSLDNIRYVELDRLFQAEAEKIMGLRRWRIERGDTDSLENDISYYQDPVPDQFAKDFRQARNRIAHTDFRRSGAKQSITLPQFYEKYHKFIIVMYEEPYWQWYTKAESYDWGEIEQFGKIIQASINSESQKTFWRKMSDLIFFKLIKETISTRRETTS